MARTRVERNVCDQVRGDRFRVLPAVLGAEGYGASTSHLSPVGLPTEPWHRDSVCICETSAAIASVCEVDHRVLPAGCRRRLFRD